MSSSPAESRRDRCLVAGYDRSPASMGAIRWAAERLRDGGRLVVVHSCRPLHAPPSPLLSRDERLGIGRAVVDELLLEEAELLEGLSLSTEVLDEDPVSSLLGAAARHGADAIVVGSEPRSAARRALGVVTTELLSRSPLPVYAIPLAAAGAG